MNYELDIGLAKTCENIQPKISTSMGQHQPSANITWPLEPPGEHLVEVRSGFLSYFLE